MRVVTPEEMALLDEQMQKEFLIPEEILIERAGMAVFRAVVERVSSRGNSGLADREITAIAGGGHNGADSLVALRHLCARGFRGAAVLMESDTARQSEAVRREVARLLAMGIPILGPDDKGVRHRLTHAGVLLDGLLGTGFHGEVREPHRRMIDAINRAGEAGGHVVAVDLPSGVDGLTGAVASSAVRADMTVTFGAPKWGILVDPGTRYAGAIHVSPIGMPGSLLAGGSRFCLTPSEAMALLPRRHPAMHKGQAGHVLILGGSPGTTGASFLSARGALRMGSGLVTILWETSAAPLSSTLPEAMGRFYDGTTREKAVETVLAGIRETEALAVGPGLLPTEVNRAIVEALLSEYSGPLVADAGIFSLFAENPEGLGRMRKGPMILTPHPGELARLMGVPTAEILRDPSRWAGETARKTSSVVLLKGARTVISDLSGTLCVNLTGRPVMAGPGMGDVLSGMIASLLGQSMAPFEAACLGATLHGALGNRLDGTGSRGHLASGLADGIPGLLSDWERLPDPLASRAEDPFLLWPTEAS